MRFPDDKDKENKDKYINGAECERKQGNDEGRHCNKITHPPPQKKKKKQQQQHTKQDIQIGNSLICIKKVINC